MERWTGIYPTGLVFQDKEGGGGSGGGGSQGGSGEPDIEATVRRILNQKDSDQAVYDLLKDNFQQREEIRQLRDQLDGAEAVPAGGKVLSAEEAKAYEAYQELGKPEEIQKGLQEKETLEQKVEQTEREKRIAEAASAAKYKPEVLQKLPGSDQVSFETKTEAVDGEETTVPYVTELDDEGKPKGPPVKLTDYAEKAWPEFLPALAAEAEEKSQGGGTGISFPPQQSRGTPRKSGPVSEEDARKATVATADYSL